jgi:hypothetical protein
MQRGRLLEGNARPVVDRGADQTAPRSSPLAIVSGAVAGDDLCRVATSASEAIGRPVAIAIPAIGEPVVWPPSSFAASDLRLIVAHATAVISAEVSASSLSIADAVPVRIGREVVGVVAASPGEPGRPPSADERTWLEGAAAAAAVTALMRAGREGDLDGSPRALLQALAAGPPADVDSIASHARRLGLDLSAGAVAICAQATPGSELGALGDLRAKHGALLAVVEHGRVLGLIPLSTLQPGETAESLVAGIASRGVEIACSTPRRDPAALHDALREAELLIELDRSPETSTPGQEETYRLLIGVLLRDPEELEQLRERTVSPLIGYDSRHDTELVATLHAFLAHHGSTTETAEAMSLHRHTVGYRLSRVHEVSGLSPYESDGRERLSLGLKADQILAADKRRTQYE